MEKLTNRFSNPHLKFRAWFCKHHENFYKIVELTPKDPFLLRLDMDK